MTKHTRRLPAVSVPLHEAPGAILARPVTARTRMPRFDQSAVDGYAVRVGDCAGAGPDSPARLSLRGEMPIGPGARCAVPAYGAVRVNTGSRLHRGTGAVVMKEHCRAEGRTIAVLRRVSPGDNVRLAGEEQRAGDRLLPAGVRVSPSVVGLAAAAGGARLVIWRRPAVAIIATGDELALPGATLARGMIHDANSPALAAGLGMRVGFSGVAIKPGKPVFFGTFGRDTGGRGRHLLFGMPGNPVAARTASSRSRLSLSTRPPVRWSGSSRWRGTPDAGTPSLTGDYPHGPVIRKSLNFGHPAGRVPPRACSKNAPPPASTTPRSSTTRAASVSSASSAAGPATGSSTTR